MVTPNPKFSNQGGQIICTEGDDDKDFKGSKRLHRDSHRIPKDSPRNARKSYEKETK